jgi:hypothetical protein
MNKYLVIKNCDTSSTFCDEIMLINSNNEYKYKGAQGISLVICDDTNFSDYLSYDDMLVLQVMLKNKGVEWANLNFKIKLIEVLRYINEAQIDLDNEIKLTKEYFI